MPVLGSWVFSGCLEPGLPLEEHVSDGQACFCTELQWQTSPSINTVPTSLSSPSLKFWCFNILLPYTY